MAHRRSRPAALADWPDSLRHLIRSAEAECPSGHAAAWRERAMLAFLKVPARGIFDPPARGDDDVFAAMGGVAQSHLELARARETWRAALDAPALSMEQRDDIESAAL